MMHRIVGMKISDLLLADDVGLDLPPLVLHQHALQLLLYVLHLLLVPRRLEDSQSSLQIHFGVSNPQTAVDSAQKLERAG